MGKCQCFFCGAELATFCPFMCPLMFNKVILRDIAGSFVVESMAAGTKSHNTLSLCDFRKIEERLQAN